MRSKFSSDSKIRFVHIFTSAILGLALSQPLMAEAWKASSLAWTWAEAETSTTAPVHACGQKEFEVLAQSTATCFSPAAGGQAFADAVARLAWGGTVTTTARLTGTAGTKADEDAAASLSVDLSQLKDHVLTLFLSGSIGKTFDYQASELEFICYIKSPPQTLEEARQPPTDILRSGLIRLSPGASSPSLSGIFAGGSISIQEANGSFTLSGSVDCPFPADVQSDHVAVWTRAHSASDTGSPSCELTSKSMTQLTVTVQDAGSGLANIQHTETNASVGINPSSYAGSTSPVVVTATKVDTSKSASLQLTVTDQVGNVKNCDPVMVGLVVGKNGRPKVQTLTGLRRSESRVTVLNGQPGLEHLQIRVNGVRFSIRSLEEGQETTLDISSAMLPGRNNVVTLKAAGEPGASATILIHD